MSIELSSPTVEERITEIQLTAYENLGIAESSIPDHLSNQENQFHRSMVHSPDYEMLIAEMVHGPNTHQHLEFAKPANLPFQDPVLYSWLNALWRYHHTRVYKRDAPITESLMVTSAPTGQVNALAISGENRKAILVEDGLLHFSRSFANLISPLLYPERNGRMHYVALGEQLDTELIQNSEIIEDILILTLEYLTKGYVHPNQNARKMGNSAAAAMFHGLMSFVIEHELHHLLARPEGKHIGPRVKDSFTELWKLFEKEVVPNVSAKVNKQEVRQLFEDHQEEILADFRGINLVFAQAQADQKVWPTMDGVMLFFHMAELHRWLLLSIEDPERLSLEGKLDGVWLSITPILYGESHPYPYARRAGVLSLISDKNPALAGVYLEREQRFTQIFEAIKVAYWRRDQSAPASQRLSPKWNLSERQLLGT